MANTRPYTEAHAVASIDLAVVLADKLTSEQQDELHAELSELLAKEEFVPKEAISEGASGFERKSPDGDVTEEVHVHPGFVHVFWNEYRGWTFTRETALRRLTPVIERIRDGRLTALGLGMAYEDIFLNDTPFEYDILDVFRVGSPFIPPIVYKTGERLWKASYAGLLEDEEGDDHGTYSSLSIETSVASADQSGGDSEEAEDGEDEMIHSTEILHRQSLYLNVGNEIADVAVLWSKDSVRQHWDRLHAQNKSLMLELLSEEMINTIGLKE